MKLTGIQAESIFYKIKDELEKKFKALEKINKATNKRIRENTLNEFKKSPEYKALVLLSKTYPAFDKIVKGKNNNFSLQYVADALIKPTYTKEHLYASEYDEKRVIAKIAIGCKNSKELADAINSEYKLKNKITI